VQKYSLAAAVALLPLASIGFSTSSASAAPGAKGADRARVIVVYKDGQRGAAQRALAMSGAEVHHDLAEQRGYAVSLPAVAVEGLAHNPAIAYVEDDVKRYAFGFDASGGDEQPYGITAVQADPTTTSGPLDNNSGNVTVCIIDSGLDTKHPDHAASYSTKIRGYSDEKAGSWTTASPATWYTDENSHGTHVAGTIAALNNGSGVVGVAPNGKLNLFIVKVFGASGWAYSSNLVDALNRCTIGRNTHNPTNKLIVSMSLGGSLKSRTEESAFAAAYSNGTLSIAAAGNDGNSRVSYPAGYASVISVAAVDEGNVVASFSQYNSDVEIAAPGVGVLSTVPVGTGLAATARVGTSTYVAEPMDGSPKMSGAGPLVDCGLGGATCAGASGKVCLIERGTYDFATKVQSCKNGGGVAAIIYNNTTGPLLGTLGDVITTIPSVGIEQADGQDLKRYSLNSTATVAVEASSYAKFDGTSMATPHVSAVAALVWGEQTACTNAQIRSALNSSALPLGAAGRDVYYGYGLVQRKAALDYLVANPCGGSSGGGGGGGGTKPGKGK